MGEKNKEISDEQRLEIMKIYKDFNENKNCKIYNKEYFKYTKVTVDQYLRDKLGNTVVDKKGNPKIDKKKRNYERIPANQEIEEYLLKEVKPHVKEYLYNKDLNEVGYEISLTKEFYEYENLRSVEEIKNDLVKLNKEINELEKNL